VKESPASGTTPAYRSEGPCQLAFSGGHALRFNRGLTGSGLCHKDRIKNATCLESVGYQRSEQPIAPGLRQDIESHLEHWPPAAPTPFLLKLSADAATVVPGPQGIGGLLATDSQNNVYVAGDAVADRGHRRPRRERSRGPQHFLLQLPVFRVRMRHFHQPIRSKPHCRLESNQVPDLHHSKIRGNTRLRCG
jgi:hypothetical protein